MMEPGFPGFFSIVVDSVINSYILKSSSINGVNEMLAYAKGECDMKSRFVIYNSDGKPVFIILGVEYGDWRTTRKIADDLGFGLYYHVYEAFNYGRGESWK